MTAATQTTNSKSINKKRNKRLMYRQMYHESTPSTPLSKLRNSVSAAPRVIITIIMMSLRHEEHTGLIVMLNPLRELPWFLPFPFKLKQPLMMTSLPLPQLPTTLSHFLHCLHLSLLFQQSRWFSHGHIDCTWRSVFEMLCCSMIWRWRRLVARITIPILLWWASWSYLREVKKIACCFQGEILT